MKIRPALIGLLTAFTLYGGAFCQTDSQALVDYFNGLRDMSSAEREALQDSAEYQRHAAAYRERNRLVLEPLLTGELDPFLPTLKDGMRDPDPYIRAKAVALVGFAATNPSVLMVADSRANALRELLPFLLALTDANQNEPVRVAALEALARLEWTQDSRVAAAFQNCLKDVVPKVRAAALIGLAAIPGKENIVLEESLRRVVSDDDVQNRQLAAAILAEIQADDVRIMLTLTSASNDPSIHVRRAVADAIRKRRR
jgi:hypothetical protein